MINYKWIKHEDFQWHDLEDNEKIILTINYKGDGNNNIPAVYFAEEDSVYAKMFFKKYKSRYFYNLRSLYKLRLVINKLLIDIDKYLVFL